MSLRQNIGVEKHALRGTVRGNVIGRHQVLSFQLFVEAVTSVRKTKGILLVVRADPVHSASAA
jgi:hypothetical protein